MIPTFDEMMLMTSDIPSNFLDHTYEMVWKWIPTIKGKIVEFGTGLGKTTIAMHLMNPELEIFTNDIGNRYGTHEEYAKRIDKAFKDHHVNEDKVHFQIGSSLDVPLIENLDGLFIDSEHTYEVTRDEINRWLPMVKKGGLILFDDYGLKDTLPNWPEMWGVGQAVDELILPFPEKYELLDKGMAIVFRKLI